MTTTNDTKDERSVTVMTAEPMRLLDAEDIALELLDRMAPASERIAIAGSIRRQKAIVNDIELVAIPKIETISTDLFGTPVKQRDLLHDVCGMLREGGILADRLNKDGKPVWGSKYKRMIYKGVPVDLFSATEKNWGMIYLLRTGPAAFNRRLVTSQSFGGYLPFGMQVSEGYLWRRGERLATPAEKDIFEALGLPWVEAAERR